MCELAGLGGTHCLHIQSPKSNDDGGSMILRNVVSASKSTRRATRKTNDSNAAVKS